MTVTKANFNAVSNRVENWIEGWMTKLRKLLVLRTGLMISRALFLAVMSALMGGGVALDWLAETGMSLNAQSVDHRLTVQEDNSRTAMSEIDALKLQMTLRDQAAEYRDKRIAELENRVSVMQGIGIGIGGIGILAQILQVFFAREIRKMRE